MKESFKWLYTFNYLSIRKRMLLIYLLCIFIPILVINFIYYRAVNNAVQEKNISYYQNNLSRLQNSIYEVLDKSIQASNIIYSNLDFARILMKRYDKNSDFIIDKIDLDIDSSIRMFQSGYPQIDEITFYTTNNTITRGGYFEVITNDDISNFPFNIILSQTGKSIFYIEENKYSINNSLSLVRHLWKDTSTIDEHILKIDISLNTIKNILLNESIKGNIQLINQSNNQTIIELKNNSKELEATTDFLTLSKTIQIDNYNVNWIIKTQIPADIVKKTSKDLIINFLLLSCISIFIVTLIERIVAYPLEKRLQNLSKHMLDVHKTGNLKLFSDTDGKDEITQTIRSYNQMILKIKKLMNDIYKAGLQKNALELETKKAQLVALQSNIDPHFLYNTLNTIKMKSLIKGEKETASIINDLSRLFRKTTTWDQSKITISEELSFIESYLKIQKYRFEDSFDYEITANSETLDCIIPKMCLQPFVENACIHGIEKKKNSGKLLIKIDFSNQKLRIMINDDGIGMTKEKAESLIHNSNSISTNHIGISNVYKRLSLEYGNAFYFMIESKINIGTNVTIHIPIKK